MSSARARWCRFAVVILALAGMPASPPARGQSAAAVPRADLAERNRLREQSQRLWASGDVAGAIAAAEARLAIERRVLPEGHADQCASLDWLAALYERRDDFARAIQTRREALATARRAFPENDWRLTSLRINLANSEAQARMSPAQRAELALAARLDSDVTRLYFAGRCSEAVKPARQALKIREALLGNDHTEVSRSLSSLGRLLQSQGDGQEARPLLERALTICEAKKGKDHPDCGRLLNYLGETLQSLGDLTIARSLFERALTICESKLGESHGDSAASLNGLATILGLQGDITAARALYERLLAIDEAKLGKDHPDIAVCLNNLAWNLWSGGDYAAARPLFERARSDPRGNGWRGSPGHRTRPDRPRMGAADSGRLRQGAPLYERALPTLEAKLGKDHRDTLIAMENLASLLQAQGDYATARTLLERALATLEAKLGKDHRDTSMALENLGSLLQAQEDYAAARPLFERCLAIREATLGKDHPDSTIALINLAGVLGLQGDYARARTLLERALATREAIFGREHPETAVAVNNLAYLFVAQGDYGRARPLLERTLEIREAKLGTNHPDTAESLMNLAGLLYFQGDYTAARSQFERALAISRQNLDRAAVAQSEREQFAMADRFLSQLGSFLSSAPRLRATPAEIYNHILVWKGAILERQRRERELRRRMVAVGDQKLLHLLDQREAVVAQLATLALADPDRRAGAAEPRKRELERLNKQEDDLERDLAQRSAAFRVARAEDQIDSLRWPRSCRAAPPLLTTSSTTTPHRQPLKQGASSTGAGSSRSLCAPTRTSPGLTSAPQTRSKKRSTPGCRPCSAGGPIGAKRPRHVSSN